jgi:hypothetical protein
MAFAYWIARVPQSFCPVLNSGDAAILYCFMFRIRRSRTLEHRRHVGEEGLGHVLVRACANLRPVPAAGAWHRACG